MLPDDWSTNDSTCVVDQLLSMLDSCDPVCGAVNNHIAHTTNSNANDWTLKMGNVIDAHRAICKVAVVLNRDVLQRTSPAAIIPVPRFEVMEEFEPWVSTDNIKELQSLWNAHCNEVDAWIAFKL